MTVLRGNSSRYHNVMICFLKHVNIHDNHTSTTVYKQLFTEKCTISTNSLLKYFQWYACYLYFLSVVNLLQGYSLQILFIHSLNLLLKQQFSNLGIYCMFTNITKWPFPEFSKFQIGNNATHLKKLRSEFPSPFY